MHPQAYPCSIQMNSYKWTLYIHLHTIYMYVSHITHTTYTYHTQSTQTSLHKKQDGQWAKTLSQNRENLLSMFLFPCISPSKKLTQFILCKSCHLLQRIFLAAEFSDFHQSVIQHSLTYINHLCSSSKIGFPFPSLEYLILESHFL